MTTTRTTWRSALEFGTLAALLGLLFAAAPRIAAQNPPPAQKPASAAAAKPAHAKKVWTNDDVIALRTSADLYQLEQDRKAEEARKAAEESAAQTAKAAAEPAASANPQQANQAPQPAAPPAPALPSRPEDIQKRINEIQQQVSALELQLSNNDQELNAAREDQKQEVMTRRAATADQLAAARAELKALQDKLQQIRGAGS